jgi:uncharacterized protein YcnI
MAAWSGGIVTTWELHGRDIESGQGQIQKLVATLRRRKSGVTVFK